MSAEEAVRASAVLADDVARSIVGDGNAYDRLQGEDDSWICSFFGELLFLHDAEEAAFVGWQVVEQATDAAQRATVVTLAEIEEAGVSAAMEACFPCSPGLWAEQTGSCQPDIGTERSTVIAEAVVAGDDEEGAVEPMRKP